MSIVYNRMDASFDRLLLEKELRSKKRIRTILEKYGKDCFKQWGKLGAISLWERYKKNASWYWKLYFS